MSANPSRADITEAAAQGAMSTSGAPLAPALPNGVDPWNGEILRRKVAITNPQGFHMRPAAAFAQLASNFNSHVTVSKDSVRANGKSSLELMLLVAEQGSELEIEVSGADAVTALEALSELLARPAPDEVAGAPPTG